MVIYVIMLKIAEIFYKKISLNWLLFCTFNFKEIVAENAGNRISEVVDFKILGSAPGVPSMLNVRSLIYMTMIRFICTGSNNWEL